MSKLQSKRAYFLLHLLQNVTPLVWHMKGTPAPLGWALWVHCLPGPHPCWGRAHQDVLLSMQEHESCLAALVDRFHPRSAIPKKQSHPSRSLILFLSKEETVELRGWASGMKWDQVSSRRPQSRVPYNPHSERIPWCSSPAKTSGAHYIWCKQLGLFWGFWDGICHWHHFIGSFWCRVLVRLRPLLPREPRDVSPGLDENLSLSLPRLLKSLAWSGQPQKSQPAAALTSSS